MDTSSITELAVVTVNTLEPFWEIFAKGALEDITQKVPTAVRQLWNSVCKRFSKKEQAQESIEDLMVDYKEPDTLDPDSIPAFRKQLKKLLIEDAEFTDEIRALTNQAHVEINQSWQSHAVIAGDGNVSTQGDHNTIIQIITDSHGEKKN